MLDKQGGVRTQRTNENSLYRTDPRKWFSPSVYHSNIKQHRVLPPEITDSIEAQSYFAYVLEKMRNLQENVSVIKIRAVTVMTTTTPVGSVQASCLDLVLWNYNQLDLHAFASGVVSGNHSWLLFKFHFPSFLWVHNSKTFSVCLIYFCMFW